MMKNVSKNSIRVFICVFFVYLNSCFSVFEDISNKINEFSPCLSTSTLYQSYGCTSEFEGNTGRLFIIRDEAEFKELLISQTVEDRAILMANKLFTGENLYQMKNSVNNIAAILVANAGPLGALPEKPVSPEFKYCDSDNMDSIKLCDDQSSSNQWNPNGDGSLYFTNNFPIMLLNNEDEINELINCHDNIKINNGLFTSNGTCYIKVNSLMYSAKQSALVCARKNENPFVESSFCTDMSSKNIFASLSDYHKQFDSDKKSIVITAKMDHRSLFYWDISGGAQSTGIALATFLSISNVMAQIMTKDINFLKDTDLNIIFVLFDGEAWDFIGSNRFVYDLKKKSIFNNDDFKAFNKSSIAYVLELDQLGFLASSNDDINSSIYLHTINSTKNKLLDSLRKYFNQDGLLNALSSINKYPPSSVAQLSNQFESDDFKTVLISDYDLFMKNKYFHSHMDTASSMNFTFGADEKLSNTHLKQYMDKFIFSVTKSILYLSGKSEQYINNLDFNNFDNMFSELLFCITKNSSCSLYKKLIPENVSSKQLKARYFNDGNNPFLFKRILSYFLGNSYPLNSDECSSQVDNKMYYNYNATDICILNASVYETSAYISRSLKSANHKLPYWVESTYSSDISITYFYKSPQTLSYITFGIGVGINILFLVVTIIIKKYLSNIF